MAHQARNLYALMPSALWSASKTKLCADVLKLSAGVIASTVIMLSVPTLGLSQTFTDYPQGGVQPKNGWDSFRNLKTSGNCVEGDTVTDPGSTTDVDFTEIDDASSLMDALKISVHAKAGLIGGASGSADATFSRQVTLTSTGTNIAVHVLTTNGATYLIPTGSALTVQQKLLVAAQVQGLRRLPADTILQSTSIHLTQRAKKLITQGRFKDFRSLCGDSFVSAVSTASGIDGVVVADTKGKDEKTAVTAAVEAGYGAFAGGASTNTTTDVMQSENRIHIKYHQVGGGPTITVAQSVKDFHQLVANIGSAANPTFSPKTLLEYTPYTNLLDYYQASEGDLGHIANQYFRLFSFTAAANEVIGHPEEFILDEGADVNSVAKLATKAQNDMGVLQAALANCGGNKTCVYPAPPFYPTDYDYRAGLPLTKADGEPWASAAGLRQAIANDQQALSNVSPTVSSFECDIPDPPPLTGCIRGHYTLSPNSTYVKLQAEIASDQQKLSGINAFPDDEIRFRVYVFDTNTNRCAVLAEQDACITGTTLNDYRAFIVRSDPKIPHH